MIELTPFGVISIRGPQATEFLQSQITFDLNDIEKHTLPLAAYCNLQGRAIALFFILAKDHEYDLILPRDNIEKTLTILKKYAVFSKVDINDMSHSMVVVANFLPPENTPQLTCVDRADFKPADIDDDFSTWQLHLIEQGIPTLYHVNSEAFVAQRLNLDHLGAISFEKGCYLGQEVIARLHFRGQTKHHMARVMLSTAMDLAPGDKILLNNREVGTLVDAVRVEQQQWQALAVIADMATNEQVITIKDQAINCKFINLVVP